MVKHIFSYLALILHGAIFGFFFAWVCSTIWGLNTLAPDIAIQAMQAMNASVRNPVFAPAFFFAPLASLLAAVLFYADRKPGAGTLFLMAALVYGGGGIGVTFWVHVPLNEALALVSTDLPAEALAARWNGYVTDWEFWNILRTCFSGLALLLVGLALRQSGRH
jgi:uncharacterized membrane protein